MKKQASGQAFPVCRTCGAVARPGSLHCTCCGAPLDAGMQLPPDGGSGPSPWHSAPKGRPIPQRPEPPAPQKHSRVLGVLSLLFGILAILTIVAETSGGFLLGIAAVILGAVQLGRKQGGGVLAGVGLGLGIFALLILGFWTLVPFLYWM